MSSRRREDERFAILYIEDRGKGKKGNAIFVRDAQQQDKRWNPADWRKSRDDEYYVVENVDDKLFIKTNKGAPNWKVVLVDLKNPSRRTGPPSCRRNRNRSKTSELSRRKDLCEVSQRRHGPCLRL